jgi:hypothetical protein
MGLWIAPVYILSKRRVYEHFLEGGVTDANTKIWKKMSFLQLNK